MSDEIDIIFTTHYKVNKETKESRFLEGKIEVDGLISVTDTSKIHYKNYNNLCKDLGYEGNELKQEII